MDSKKEAEKILKKFKELDGLCDYSLEDKGVAELLARMAFLEGYNQGLVCVKEKLEE